MELNKYRISIIGLGYIGLPTATFLASKGCRVYGYDANPRVIEKLQSGKVHIVEEGLQKRVNFGIKSGKLTFHNKLQPADIYIICVPTPFTLMKGKKVPDLSYVIDATENIANLLKKGDSIILESTSPVGTSQKIYSTLRKGFKQDFYMAYCPERVLPGKIFEELESNVKIVGGIDGKSTNRIATFFKKVISADVVSTDSKTAELIKLIENSYRDVNIAFANEISMLCDDYDIDYFNAIKLANLHPRVNILQPGPGVGGHCIAVDPWFLISDNHKNTRLIKTGREINTLKESWVINRIKAKSKELQTQYKKELKIGIYGLTFKPNIDDLRESPALKIAQKIALLDCEVFAIEPNITSFKGLKMMNINESIDAIDLKVFLVKHKEFCKRSFLKSIQGNQLLDFCGIFQ